MHEINNIFNITKHKLTEEFFEDILKTKFFRIERIISDGHVSPKGFWYNQEEDEFVLMLKGSAEIEFEEGILKLNSGDYLNIPAHTKHRIKWTDLKEKCFWLAVHYNKKNHDE
ncbi:cupin domain-containing protein [Bacteroidota bacterium]